MTKTIGFTVNGKPVSVALDNEATPLLDVLRNHLNLMGTRFGCGLEQCGACTVLIDGRSARSCLTLAVQAEGADIRTIESEAKDDGSLSALQQAFQECHGLQCGYCTPGMIMNIRSHFDSGEELDLSDAGIRELISGNLCRCTGYANIVKAVRRAAELAGRA